MGLKSRKHGRHRIATTAASTAALLVLLATIAVGAAAAAPLWSSLPKPFPCPPSGKIAPDNSCVAHTGFDPNAGSGLTTPWWGQYRHPKGNCTAYVAYRLIKNKAPNFLVPGQGSAVHWRTHARNAGKRVDDRPAVGAVAWWSHGHVAYVEKVSDKGRKIHLSESHWPTKWNPAGSRRLIVTRGSSRWPDNFLHIKDKPAAKKNPLSRYAGKIVQWKDDRKSQKTAWLVDGKLRRRWIPTAEIYHCLKANGVAGPIQLPASTLDKLKDRRGVHATCTPKPGNAPKAPPPAPEHQPTPPKPETKSKAKPNISNKLSNDQRLRRGEYLRSQDGRYRFVMQTDSNLVLYGPSGKPLWASNTVGRGADHVRMQGDGNLVIYKSSGKPIWASNTPRHYKTTLVVQNDGNVVIYNSGKPIWATHTDGRK